MSDYLERKKEDIKISYFGLPDFTFRLQNAKAVGSQFQEVRSSFAKIDSSLIKNQTASVATSYRFTKRG